MNARPISPARSDSRLGGRRLRARLNSVLGREDWILAARTSLIRDGINAVNVLPLAAKLKVTRGDFYWHFRDRAVESTRQEEVQMEPEKVAQVFAATYATCWNEGSNSVGQLYAPDAILVGADIVTGRPGIRAALDGLIAQGWTSVSIKVAAARAEGEAVLAACEHSAMGTGKVAGQKLDARSTYVLIRKEGDWLIAMHTAT